MERIIDDNLMDIVSTNKRVIAMIAAEWCGACKNILPEFERLSGEMENIKFIYVDADKQPNSRRVVSLNGIPTFVLFEDGGIITHQTTSNKDKLTKLFDNFSKD